MFGRYKNEKTIYAIIGLGRFGEALALDLAQRGSEIMVVDRNEEKIREMRDYTENAWVVQNLDKKTLMETGIQNCDIAIVCIGEKLDTSILTTLNLISMGIPKVIAKANSPEHGEILEKLGAEVVYPEKDMALRLASRLVTSRVLDLIQLSEKINISKLSLPDCLIGRTVLDVNFRAKFHMNIIAIENNGTVIENITPDYEFRDEDVLFVSGQKEDLMRFFEWVERQ